ncbi:transglycosylase domain-containing protein [Roseateles sp. P5_E4]
MQWLASALAGLLGCCTLGILAFDLLVVRPHAASVERALDAAAPSERQPPAALRQLLHRAYGDLVKFIVARNLVLASAREDERMSGLRRMFTEAGVALLLPLHVSETQLEGALLSSAYMGSGIRGFAAVSQHYLGVPLERVDSAQAARLLAIEWVPSSLDSPERLERRVRWLLSVPPLADRSASGT